VGDGGPEAGSKNVYGEWKENIIWGWKEVRISE
jgi:hypothetical protein